MSFLILAVLMTPVLSFSVVMPAPVAVVFFLEQPLIGMLLPAVLALLTGCALAGLLLAPFGALTGSALRLLSSAGSLGRLRGMLAGLPAVSLLAFGVLSLCLLRPACQLLFLPLPLFFL